MRYTRKPSTADLKSSTFSMVGSLRRSASTSSCKLSGIARPRRYERFLTMSTTATAPRSVPITIEPAASQITLPVRYERVMLKSAIHTPKTATASSRNTARVEGSACARRLRHFERGNVVFSCCAATINVYDSMTSAKMSTANTTTDTSISCGLMSVEMPWYVVTPAPIKKMPHAEMSAQKESSLP